MTVTRDGRDRFHLLRREAPTVREMRDAMLALSRGKITPDAYREIMRRSREARTEAEHDRLKTVALANFDRNVQGEAS
jgi:hypothetical protein